MMQRVAKFCLSCSIIVSCTNLSGFENRQEDSGFERVTVEWIFSSRPILFLG